MHWRGKYVVIKMIYYWVRVDPVVSKTLWSVPHYLLVHGRRDHRVMEPSILHAIALKVVALCACSDFTTLCEPRRSMMFKQHWYIWLVAEVWRSYEILLIGTVVPFNRLANDVQCHDDDRMRCHGGYQLGLPSRQVTTWVLIRTSWLEAVTVTRCRVETGCLSQLERSLVQNCRWHGVGEVLYRIVGDMV